MADAKGTKGKDESMSNGLPAGFRRRNAVTDAPWFTAKEGNVAFGKLLGRYVMQNVDPARAYYQVELYKACTVTVGRGNEAEEKEAAKGEVVNVGETFRLQCLKEIEIPEIMAGGDYDVFIEVEKKIKLSGGKTMWVIEVGSKCTKRPTGEVRPLPKDESVLEGAEGEAGSPF